MPTRAAGRQPTVHASRRQCAKADAVWDRPHGLAARTQGGSREKKKAKHHAGDASDFIAHPQPLQYSWNATFSGRLIHNIKFDANANPYACAGRQCDFE